ETSLPNADPLHLPAVHWLLTKKRRQKWLHSAWTGNQDQFLTQFTAPIVLQFPPCHFLLLERKRTAPEKFGGWHNGS
uniref:Uncharacterized protein n=1 Tax=Triticum urartu TaxID=4572 RepID=A0A8R7UKZ5_TRIUA